jgi:hypothetical protein
MRSTSSANGIGVDFSTLAHLWVSVAGWKKLCRDFDLSGEAFGFWGDGEAVGSRCFGRVERAKGEVGSIGDEELSMTAGLTLRFDLGLSSFDLRCRFAGRSIVS